MSTEPLDPSQLPSSMAFDEDDLDKTLITTLPETFLAATEGLFLKSVDSAYPLPLGPMIIGRDASCSLTLHSRRVSRHHAAIYRQGKNYILRDLHSTNGIMVNGKQVAQSLLRPGDKIRMGDQFFEIVEGQYPAEQYHHQAIVVFVDLADSTRLTEKYGKPFSEHMRLMMRKLEDQVLVHRGCPVKLLGDGLMCAFDLWPVQENNYQPFDKALQFAQKAVKLFRSIKDYEPLRVRVGLHYGDIVLSETPHFDLFGDTVNTAARLEACNKYYGTQIMVSESFYARTRFQDYLREVDQVKVMGRDRPVTLYTWDGVFHKTKKQHHRQPYERGLAAYREGDFNTATQIWQRGLKQDKLCQPLLQRVENLPDAPPNWNGVWSLDK